MKLPRPKPYTVIENATDRWFADEIASCDRREYIRVFDGLLTGLPAAFSS
jgi:hypothetical protein